MHIDNNASTVWKGILSCRDTLKNQIKRCIENEEETCLWKDLRLNGQSLIARLGWDTLASVSGFDLKVNKIITQNRWLVHWKFKLYAGYPIEFGILSYINKL